MTTTELKNAIRTGKYAWPGGYPKYFVTNDGEAMSFDSVKENYRLVLDSVKHGNSDGWCVVDVDINWEDDYLTCCHSGEIIESAYGESAT